jgi:hypothetical protein
MLIVRDDPEAVEADLSAGLLRCPSCQGGVLARWGFARWRELLDGTTLRPRRAACLAGCGATHVLLPDTCLARRRYSAEVIGVALTAVLAGGEAYTDTACRLGVPPARSSSGSGASVAGPARSPRTSWPGSSPWHRVTPCPSPRAGPPRTPWGSSGRWRGRRRCASGPVRRGPGPRP